MKRIASTGLITLASLFFVAAQASAVNLFFGAPSATDITVGEEVTIQMFLDTEGETQMTSVFVSAAVDPAVLEFVSGTSPASILFNFSSYSSLGRLSQPFVLGSDPEGRVRAVSFGALEPSGVARADQLVATLTFVAVGAGSSVVDGLVAPGDDVTVSGLSIAPQVTFDPSELITVPEPASVLLSLSALGTVCLIRRRSSVA